MQTLPALLGSAPPDNIAVILPESGIRVTYASLRSQVAQMADALAACGIGRNDRVAIALPNGLPALVSFLAVATAGTAAPLNPGYRQEEFRFFLEDTAARLLIVPPDGGEQARRAAADLGISVITAGGDASGAVSISAPSCGASAGEPAPEATALVLHTSGSTGRPKRVPLRHRHLAVSAANVAATYRLTAGDVALCVMPLFHVHGLVASALATLASGGAVVVPAKFNPLSFWGTARDCEATWYSAVPTIHQLLLARAGAQRPEGSERLRFIRSCSAPLAAETGRRLEEAFGVPVLEAYGMTEAAHQMASNPLPPAVRKFGTVGPGTGVRIRILEGEVVIQGPNVVDGYENNPEANAASYLDDGGGRWFRTGDQGMLDADGYLRLTGRLKELINRGGEKISPVEIDEVLLACPAVAEAVTFPMPHPGWGEEVAAAVVLRSPATEAEILTHCRGRLADFKAPKKIHIVDAIPRTATGKVQRLNVAASLREKG